MESKATHEVTIGVRPVQMTIYFLADGSINATNLQYAQVQSNGNQVGGITSFNMNELAGGIADEVADLGQQLADAMFEAVENFKPKTSRRR